MAAGARIVVRVRAGVESGALCFLYRIEWDVPEHFYGAVEPLVSSRIAWRHEWTRTWRGLARQLKLSYPFCAAINRDKAEQRSVRGGNKCGNCESGETAHR